MVRARIDYRGFEKLLLTEFPELRDEIRDWKGLGHLQMMEFRLFTERAWKRQDWKTVERCLQLAERLLRLGDLRIKNAVYVSYLEGLPRKGKVHNRLRRMMTAGLRKGWDAILGYLDSFRSEPGYLERRRYWRAQLAQIGLRK
jgi:hypothetical protein